MILFPIMGDLDNSPLFDSRHIQFISSIVYSSRLNSNGMNPISSAEQKFKLYTDEILAINDYCSEKRNASINENLIERLNRYKDYISVHVAIRFLILAYKGDALHTAFEILESSVEEERGGSFESLVNILKESETVPPQWTVILYGEPEDHRHKPPESTLNSGLNLDAMKNFK